MNILAIETSCDETALSIINTAESTDFQPQFEILSDLVISQIDTHIPYGGVFPALAKREHAKNLVPLLESSLRKAGLYQARTETNSVNETMKSSLATVLEREPELYTTLINLIEKIERPNIDMIMVTYGPGLAPALWVGVNFARALSVLWNIPIIPVNHMEGHITSTILKDDYTEQKHVLTDFSEFSFPMIALLISGGHTQLVLVRDWADYEIIGETIDDAVGEAFDKVARMLDMEYPGGPKVSMAAKKGDPNELISLPRPMINTKDFQFSFSGLKTAVRYLIEDLKKSENFNEQIINDMCFEFEQAVTEVLLKKTQKAVDTYNAKGIIIAGGVSANQFITNAFKEYANNEGIAFYNPHKKLCGDNSLMIATAGVINLWKQKTATVPEEELVAVGNLKI